MKVLIACEFSGTVRDAFIRAGHDAVSCDLLPTESPGPHIVGDVTGILRQGWDLMVAHPPCTFLCNSGVRWLWERPERMEHMVDGARFFRLLLSAPIPMIAIENPIMHKYGKAIIGRDQDQTVQPHWFGDKKIKATCLWLKGLPRLYKTNDVGPPPKDLSERRKWADCHQASPGPDRGKIRSVFYKGMADAMAIQWGV